MSEKNIFNREGDASAKEINKKNYNG